MKSIKKSVKRKSSRNKSLRNKYKKSLRNKSLRKKSLRNKYKKSLRNKYKKSLRRKRTRKSVKRKRTRKSVKRKRTRKSVKRKRTRKSVKRKRTRKSVKRKNSKKYKFLPSINFTKKEKVPKGEHSLGNVIETLKGLKEDGPWILHIRHGFSCANSAKEAGGNLGKQQDYTASVLHKEGIKQAQELGKTLGSDVDIKTEISDTFYSSVIPRAIETAYYIQQGMGRQNPKVCPVKGLREKAKGVDIGIVGENYNKDNFGISQECFSKLYPKAYKNIKGDSTIQTQTRCARSLILDLSGYDNFAAVSDERFDGGRMNKTREEYGRHLYDTLMEFNNGKKFIPVVSHGGVIEKLTGVKVDNTGIVAYKPVKDQMQIRVVYDGVKKITGGGGYDENCRPTSDDCWKSQKKIFFKPIILN